MRESYAWSSASPFRPGPSGSSGKTKSRRLEMRGDTVDGQQRPVCAPWRFAVSAFLPVELYRGKERWKGNEGKQDTNCSTSGNPSPFEEST